MTIKRIFALIGVFLLGTGGWMILSGATTFRSIDYSDKLGNAVAALWGGAMTQQSPEFFVKIPGSKRLRYILPEANTVQIKLDLEYRRKGLIWHPTYHADFSAAYVITNRDAVKQKVQLHFPFPSERATYDGFKVKLDEEILNLPVNTHEGINTILELAPGQSKTFHVSYRTRGLDVWRYYFDRHAGRVRQLDLTMQTNFSAIDFPSGSLSPSIKKQQGDGGMLLIWKAEDLITAQFIGMLMPKRLNPGPLSSRMSLFAPVCLLFFFVLLMALNIVYKVNIHPMHYLFVTAGFFSFHLLFAYLVGLINVHLSFGISAAVSLLLVSFYLRAALGRDFPWKIALGGQFFYLVLFSYSFFLKGITGITITVGSVLTLAVLMKVTAHINWEEVFGKQKQAPGKPTTVATEAAKA